MFSKGLFLRGIKSRDYVVKGLKKNATNGEVSTVCWAPNRETGYGQQNGLGP